MLVSASVRPGVAGEIGTATLATRYSFNARHDLARFSHLPDGRNPWREPWWYRVEFDLEELDADRRLWLDLLGLNYRAEAEELMPKRKAR